MKRVLLFMMLFVLLGFSPVTEAANAPDLVEQKDVATQDLVGAETAPAPVADPSPVTVADPAKPWEGETDVNAVVDSLTGLADVAKTGETMAIVSAVIFFLLGLFKLPLLKTWLGKLVPSRWLSVVAVILGVLWGVVSQAGTIGWWPAITAGFFAGGGAVTLYEVIVRAVAGKNDRKKVEIKSAYLDAVERGDFTRLKALVG